MSLPNNLLNRVLGRLASSLTGHALVAPAPLLWGWAVLGLFLGGMGQARSDYIYWSDFTTGDIWRANIDGSGQTVLVHGQTGGALGPALDIVGGQMYWGNFSGDIHRANLDGSGHSVLIRGLDSPGAPALDLANGYMYWNSNNTPGAIRRANLDGSGQTVLVDGLSNPNSVKLDLAGGKIYWVDQGSGSLLRANLDGTGLTTLVTGLVGNNGHVALDIAGGKIYWDETYNGGDIRRANLDGSEQEILLRGLPGPTGVDLDLAHGKMYWADNDGGDIRRANLDGTGQETLITGLARPALIGALDIRLPVTFAVTAPASVPQGTAFDITVTALDQYGNTAVNYQGTVTFSTSDTDPGIALPADYTLTAGDAGIHTFPGGATLITPGDQTVTVSDTASGITHTATVTVIPGP
jgi:hypothetical protein